MGADRPHPRRPWPWAALLALGALAASAGGPAAAAPGGVEPRTQADVFERNKSSLKDVLVHVTGDLKSRANAWAASSRAGSGAGAILVLVVDPTSSMRGEMQEIHDALPEAVAAGPPGMKIGVLGAAAEWTPPGEVQAAAGALVVLKTIPLDGGKNLLESVREAADELRLPATEPRSILLVSKEGGDGEDDVEATRDLLLQRGIAFYSVAREAAFERPWDYQGPTKDVPDLGLTERLNPLPRKKTKGELFYGGDVAFGLVPYRWEVPAFPFAQTEFGWPGGGRFPVPSGFGYWPLASLSWSTGGRCFVYNFRAPGARTKTQDRTLTPYDFGFLNLFAPDLRPRPEILRALDQDPRARAIVKIWGLLADEQAPLVLDHGTLERDETGLVSRARLPVRSSTPLEVVYESLQQVNRAKAVAAERRKRGEQAIQAWKDEERRERTPSDRDPGPLARRVEADFDLLGFQLVKARFHWGEVRAALDSIKPEMVENDRRVRLIPVPVALGITMIKPDLSLGSILRDAELIETIAVGQRLASRLRTSPWELFVTKGLEFTFRLLQEDLRPSPRPDAPPPDKRPTTPPPAPPPPPPPERPGSGNGGETTAGGGK